MPNYDKGIVKVSYILYIDEKYNILMKREASEREFWQVLLRVGLFQIAWIYGKGNVGILVSQSYQNLFQ